MKHDKDNLHASWFRLQGLGLQAIGDFALKGCSHGALVRRRLSHRIRGRCRQGGISNLNLNLSMNSKKQHIAFHAPHPCQIHFWDPPTGAPGVPGFLASSNPPASAPIEKFEGP